MKEVAGVGRCILVKGEVTRVVEVEGRERLGGCDKARVVVIGDLALMTTGCELTMSQRQGIARDGHFVCCLRGNLTWQGVDGARESLGR